MAKHQDLCFERGPRSEKSEQPAPDQPAELDHRAEDSADSLPRANRIRFATGTGSLIGSQWVITAAHCVYGQTAPEHLQVLTGTNFLNQGGEIHLVDRIIVNEQWNSQTFDYDVALLHLHDTTKQKAIRLVTLDNSGNLARPGLIAIVSGWGLTQETDNHTSNVLRNVSVQLVTKQDCSGPASYAGAITDRMICAGFAEKGKDACQSDSGGPLMVPDQLGSFALAGIVSWGEGCGNPGKYGVYTFVPAVRQWVIGKSRTAS
jgi:secreted trypsin-like serine protease